MKPSLLLNLMSRISIHHHHNSVSPNAHLTNEHPARIVSAAPPASSDGFTSTKSIATRLPVSCTHSAMKSPSRRVRPPRTGVPVLGAHCGSRASTSKERWMGVSEPMCARASSITRPMPYLEVISKGIYSFAVTGYCLVRTHLSISCMLKALTLCSRRIFFSPGSTSLRPM